MQTLMFISRFNMRSVAIFSSVRFTLRFKKVTHSSLNSWVSLMLSKLDFFFFFNFEWAKILKTNFQKNTAFVIISLNFWNNHWNSRKNLFIVSMIGLHIWNSKIRSKNWEKWSFVFFLRKPIFVIPKKLETLLRSKILPQMRTLWSN